MTPRVTVLMPVYNGAAYLRPAIESILSQTYSDFEFLILDDGSTDESAAIARSYDDPRIRLVVQPTNWRLIATLNHGLDLARGEYIARMDADDISLPERLARQVAYMDAHPAVGLCGSWAEIIGKHPRRYIRHPRDHEGIRCRLLHGCSLVHPSVMMRRSLFDAHGLRYDPAYPHAEDFQLWQRAAEVFPVVNLPEVLVRYRLVPDSICHKYQGPQRATLAEIDAQTFTRLGLALDDAERTLFRHLDDWDVDLDPTTLNRLEALLGKLERHNAVSRHYPLAPFTAMLAQLWFTACHVAASRGFWTLGRYKSGPFAAARGGRVKHGFVILARFALHHLRRLGGLRAQPLRAQP